MRLLRDLMSQLGEERAAGWQHPQNPRTVRLVSQDLMRSSELVRCWQPVCEDDEKKLAAMGDGLG